MTRRRQLAVIAIASLTLLAGPTNAVAQAAVDAHYTGSLPDGATWVADVPANWNGTLLLYSHGYNPLPDNPARDAPDPTTAAALLGRGYALAGSSYSRPGFTGGTAAQDQLDTLAAVTAIIGDPRHAVAYGSSFGGMVTGQLAERGARRLDGALATCGIMGGIVDLHNYQLDGAHAIAQLLLNADPTPLKLVHYTDLGEAASQRQPDDRGTPAGPEHTRRPRPQRPHYRPVPGADRGHPVSNRPARSTSRTNRRPSSRTCSACSSSPSLVDSTSSRTLVVIPRGTKASTMDGCCCGPAGCFRSHRCTTPLG
jgi:pimeloyl-ACP methyl ester carboxylesterase